VVAHLGYLRDEVRDDCHENLVELIVDRRWTEVRDADPRLGALLGFAEKLTRDPGAMAQGDVQALRDRGLDDREIHDAVCVVAYYAFANRLADGLGVEVEDHRRDDPSLMALARRAMGGERPAHQ